ncbi:beta-1,3 glucanosyltransferase [Pseudovirgaria hyperparasitica]|uniref:1,3-beta-glucanosyltransferase n=1 Tax=Pseudovirgaria hyperparasitica TaxID=470096 RepID=A0A6A6VXF0_9PEZI|nr:beta-1,3 glucanosyltransferase [Pseudovirgaria hyperparasitica]KAF2754903.1 beta-1,3 glucanosyltransferase [Pseudovirgaria hyperparasitica]
MKAFALAAALLGAAVASPTGTVKSVTRRQDGSLPIVTTKGNAFFAGQERFYLRGVAYQPGGAADVADPLLNTEQLKHDIELFKQLSINTIRIYSVDNSKPHDEAMKMLEDAGIYLALDVNTPGFSLNRQDKESLHLSYNERYLQSVFATIDEFQKYNNLLLMISGNEIINEKNNTIAAPYIKAVIRDMKNYIAEHEYRPIPVGYAAADVAENVDLQLKYFDCGPDHQRGDFFALNDYSWCDPSSMQISGWDKKVERYKDYGAPIIMAEYGCNTNKREWQEVKALFSTQMSSVYSGGMAYEFTTEANGYGLVEEKNGEIVPNEDFERLAKAYKDQPDPEGDGGYRSQVTASECPSNSDDWEVKDLLIPSMPKGANAYMSKGAGTGPGLSKDVEPSQYGGETYSEEDITMDGEKSDKSPASVSSDGQSSTPNNSPGEGAASGLTVSLSMGLMSLAAAVYML